MISPIALTPGMDNATMIQAINDGFRQLESENRTKIIKDEAGNNRIIIGRWPDGTYGILVSKEGVDVLTLFTNDG